MLHDVHCSGTVASAQAADLLTDCAATCLHSLIVHDIKQCTLQLC